MTKHTKRPSYSQQLAKLSNLEQAFYQKDEENRQLRNQLIQMQNKITAYQIRVESLKLATTNQIVLAQTEAIMEDIRNRATIFEKWLIDGFADPSTKDEEE